MKSKLTVALLHLSLILVKSSYCSAKPKTVNQQSDLNRNVSQLITSKGYPVEEYQVETSDGYMLGIQRIPHGRFNAEVKDRPVVFLLHGLLGSSTEWILNFPDQSLGFILADQGYDVWLGNNRGNTYSTKHVTYQYYDKEFWDFSFDEFAKYDLPAMIEFALKKSNRQKLHYIGYSQGATVGFALLSERPGYNKIKSFIAFSPLVLIINVFSPVEVLSPMAFHHQLYITLFGRQDFLSYLGNDFSNVESYCESSIPIKCNNIYFQISGISNKQLNQSRSNVYGSHLPAVTSSRNIHHFAQLMNTKTFQKYSFGYSRNIQEYGQSEPPKYEFENIDIPMLLMMGESDILGDSYSIEVLASKLKNPVETYIVKDRQWESLDFVLGTDANKQVYEKVKDYLKKMENPI